MKLNNKDKLILISKYNLDLINQIINNQNLNNHKIRCSFFNGNLEIFLLNKANKIKNDYAFIFEDISPEDNTLLRTKGERKNDKAKNIIIIVNIKPKAIINIICI